MFTKVPPTGYTVADPVPPVASCSVSSASSLPSDFRSLLGPHLICFLGIQLLLATLDHHSVILEFFSDGYSWLRLLTIGNILDFCAFLTAPSLWLFLVIASTSYGRAILYYFDPITAKQALLPVHDRLTRRFHARHKKRHRKRYFCHLNHLSQAAHRNQSRTSDRAHEELYFRRQTKAGEITFHPRKPGGTTYSFPRDSPSYDSARRFQEAMKRNTSDCKPLSNRAKFHQRHYKGKADKKRYSRNSRPHRLDLSDPVFRHGISTTVRHDLHRAAAFAAHLESSTNVVMSNAKACQAAMSHDDTFSLIWDSGASMCITGDRRDFTGTIQPLNGQVSGITNGLRIKGFGTVKWSLLDNQGKLRHLDLPAYYIPKAKQRLLSTSVFCKTYPDCPIAISNKSWTIQANPTDSTQGGIDIYINPVNNLPTTTCYRLDSVKQIAANFSETITATHNDNFNLSEPQKELLRWHFKLGHVGMKTVQFIFRTGVLATSQSMRSLHTRAANLLNSDLPKCAACQFGRQTNRPVPGKTSRIIQDRAGILSADQVEPGQRVFVDHFVCSTRGRRIRGHGIRDPSGRSPIRNKTQAYSGGCIFVDASTGFVHVEFQSHLSSQETILAVEEFEKHALDNGIVVSGYSSDNGSAFTSQAFRAHLQTKSQISSYSGAGSHHQNGRAERGIRTIMAMARTMLLHSAIHWSEVADPTLWSLSVRHAVWIYNHIPNTSTGLSPIDTWSKTRFPLRKLHSLHVWGCPTYVLQKNLADGKSIGRWQPRSQRSQNMGFSEKHSLDVPYVLNIATGNITPQWNLVFDDWFTTITNSLEDLPDFNSEEWSKLFGTSTYHLPHDELSTADDDPLLPQQTSAAEQAANLVPPTPLPNSGIQVPEGPNPFITSPPKSELPAPSTPIVPPSDITTPIAVPPSTSSVPTYSQVVQVKLEPSAPPVSEALPQAPSTPVPASAALRKISDHNSTGSVSAYVPSHPTRVRRKPPTLSYDTLGGNLAELPVDDLDSSHFANYLSAYFASYGSFNDDNQEFQIEVSVSDFANLVQLDELSPHQFARVFKASSKKNPDIFTYDEAMRDVGKLKEWLAAALKEISQLESKDCWVECYKQEAYDSGQKIIPATWVFRYKRSPAGDILKCKARICLRGDLMTGDEESYAPVVSWSTVRFFLVISIMLGWTTVSVDWANAFIQAKLKEHMYMNTPRGFLNKYGSAGCLRVTKSLYGSKFAPRNWYVHLRGALLQLGLKESPIDKCLFYRDGLLLVLYVDDAGIAAPSKENIVAFVQELKDLGFDLDIEDSFSSYLGIGIEELAGGTRHMTQMGLIKKIIITTKLEDCNPNWTPTTQAALGSDPDGEPYDQELWNYASVVGMLLYLSNNTRPDITFAVSQVARFTARPKKSHAVAIKTIVRYLSRTADKGIFFKPDGTYNLKTWVDADFAGLYGREPSENKTAARSRYGYIITFGGVPLVWKSQLISEICLSTLHAEYVGLANALRAMIPIRSLVTGILDFLELPSSINPEILCKVFEDNQGAYLLATNQRLSVRTKYFCVKHHFFWSYVYHKEKNPGGWLVIVKCPTELMDADYTTKGLVRQLFEANRLRIQGW